jgi:hypothetical protein
MPLHQTIAAFTAAALLALLAAAFVPRLKRELRRPAFWLILTILAGLASATSALVAETGHAGTGFVTRHGWPKPFLFDNLRETGERFTSVEPLYFAGNALVHAAILLLAWTAWRIVRTAAAASSVRPGI